MAKMREAGLAEIAKRCKASNGSWGQVDSLGVLTAALAASSLAAADKQELIALCSDLKLFNPSQAHAMMVAAKLLPERAVKRRGSSVGLEALKAL